ncbi:tRNA nucleotidyltransferase (CCA-adding enzyme) [Bacillus thermophilus]|uniref:CCA-adding enzyme n=1 Tax=Siminovitchia thermophila TaxID=1245522 RepID=A0ABS2R1U2_9BACI|nr:CCA tRNA nucleotidyltransferase [Siminovitchia thermophila]MBM7713613.1 tRNA nucleotidyltransferase (CCA-adding enzyme) [Siminovitchia thermophila]ONK21920.1 CCA tRNA nucleotidyltransferase [Bacillus sp. VT-16-64]
MKEPFLSALPLIHEIEAAGYEACFVGGAVRDFLLGRDIHDVDIATSATPAELKTIFSKTVDVGIEHGTIMVIQNGKSYEVTTYRSEGDYQDYRRPESVTFVRSLYEDLKRRDFTMNAIAMDKEGNFIDPFAGRLAVEKKVIVTVGSADERFQEDALRLMRAVRFVSQLGFHLEKQTEKAIKEHVDLLRHISVERITAEFEKLLDGKYKKNAFELLFHTGIYKRLPSLFNQEHVVQSVTKLEISPLKELDIWLLALYFSGEHPVTTLKKWRLPSKKIKLLSMALSYLMLRKDHFWSRDELFTAGKEIALLVETAFLTIKREDVQLAHLLDKYESLPIKSLKELTVNGNDLIRWTGKQSGPWIGKVLHEAAQAVINGEIANHKQEIRSWMENCRLI